MERVDARGKTCPLPIIETKKVLESMTEGTVEVLVDNAIAVQNLCKMAEQKKMKAVSEKQSEDCYMVTITVEAGSQTQPDAAPVVCMPDGRSAGTVVALTAETMGTGDDVLGKILMKGFVYALTEQDQLPETIVLYNGGAKLSVEGAETLADLKLMEAQGVEILTCGTCLNHYGLSEKLAVGSVTNMYRIAEVLSKAGKVIRP